MNAFNRRNTTCNSLLAKVMLLAALCSGTSAAFATCPDESKYGERFNYSFAQLSSSRSFDVTAGGDLNLYECEDVPGHGWITERPDYSFTLTRGSRQRNLEFRVEADPSCDATLVVNTSNGSWRFDDDSGAGLNPKITINNASGGVYDVWVGTNDEDVCNARLIVTSRR